MEKMEKKKKEKEKLLMEAYGEPWVYKKFTTELFQRRGKWN